jgi:hypothetical protein
MALRPRIVSYPVQETMNQGVEDVTKPEGGSLEEKGGDGEDEVEVVGVKREDLDKVEPLDPMHIVMYTYAQASDVLVQRQ